MFVSQSLMHMHEKRKLLLQTCSGYKKNNVFRFKLCRKMTYDKIPTQYGAALTRKKAISRAL